MNKIFVLLLLIAFSSCNISQTDDSHNYQIKITKSDPRSGSAIKVSDESLEIYYKVEYSISDGLFIDSLYFVDFTYMIDDGEEYSWNQIQIDSTQQPINAVISLDQLLTKELYEKTLHLSARLLYKPLDGYVSTLEHAEWLDFKIK